MHSTSFVSAQVSSQFFFSPFNYYYYYFFLLFSCDETHREGKAEAPPTGRFFAPKHPASLQISAASSFILTFFLFCFFCGLFICCRSSLPSSRWNFLLWSLLDGALNCWVNSHLHGRATLIGFIVFQEAKYKKTKKQMNSEINKRKHSQSFV